MAFISDTEHDMFVSYAHRDNEPDDEGMPGWVDELIRKVRGELRRRLGNDEFRIWSDHQLSGNLPLTQQLLETASKSAMLLVVLSPSYLNSAWCERERRAFLSLIENRIAEGRVFVVQALDVDRDEIPPEFGDLVGYKFFTQDAQTGADQRLHFSAEAAAKEVVRLSHDIKTLALRLQGGRKNKPVAASASVFIARTTDDLAEQEVSLRAYLAQAGVRVLPEQWCHHSDRQAFEEAFAKAAQQTNIFVQLLSPTRGHPLPFEGSPYLPRLQYDLAKAKGMELFQWRARSLSISPDVAPGHAEILELARACGIEEFKRTVAERAKRRVVAKPALKPRTGMSVFVNADAADRELAERLIAALDRSFGVECYQPMEFGVPEKIRAEKELLLSSCDGLLLVYGQTDATWVRDQLIASRKVRHASASAIAAICEGPPPETKADIRVTNSALMLINCRNGLDEAELGRFVENLRQHNYA